MPYPPAISCTVPRDKNQLLAYLQTTHPVGFTTFLAPCGAANLEGIQHERRTQQCLAGFYTPVGHSDLSSPHNPASHPLAIGLFTHLSPPRLVGLKSNKATIYALS